MSDQEPAANPAFTSEVIYQLPYNGEIREGIVFGDETQTLSITATSSNASLISNPQVDYSQGSSTASLLFSIEPGQ
ncbi:MAG: hypothetical protein QGG54_19675, partial [Gammaproteobacteria bacterium]|nr:hypothetical protein [Gammaproteobacteria bacterium]